MKAEMDIETSQQVFNLTRVFDAPRELVFKAWIEPKHLQEWWGPDCFTNPVCEIDPRPGGAIRIDMRAPDGTVYPMTGVFREVVEPERLVFTSYALGADGQPMFEVLNTLTFAEQGGKTALTLEARVTGTTAAAAPYLAGMDAGWKQSLDRLGGLLARGEIIATRRFDAPRDLVFRMWTEREHVAKWWGPRGFTLTIHEMDVRPGGAWRFIMHGPDGTDYRNEVIYDEIAPPERLVYTHVSAPRFQMTVSFDERGGGTEVTARMVFESAALRDQVIGKFGAVEGLHQTLDRLGEQLTQTV
jgi:uncharacterized protein YndB with AHSA1/START domain